MGLSKSFLFGMLFSFLLTSCAAFSFHYYGLSQVSFEKGKLLGPSEKEDLPFSRCEPREDSKNPCVVMFTADFMALKLDYEDTKQKLRSCEKEREK